MTTRTRTPYQLALFALLLSFAATLHAKDWPQWRGPNRDGVSKETGLLKEWPASGPALLWQQKDIGSGYSTPAIVGDRIYVISSKGTENEFVQALDVKDGKHVWSTPIGKVGPNEGPQYPGSRATPTVDGKLTYALGSDGDIACLETKTGKIEWKKNLRSEFGGKPGNWAYCESILVDGDSIFCAPGGGSATIVALNKKSGDVIWKCALPEGDQAGNASAVIVEVDGVRQYVQVLQKGLIGVDIKTGKFLWRYDKTGGGIPTAIADKNLVFSTANRKGGGVVKLTAKDGSVQAEEVYFTPKVPSAIGGAVKVGNFIYGTTGQGMMCVDFATGDQKWQERGVGAGSICFADDRLYVYGESGDVALVVPTADSYQEKGRFTPPSAPARPNQMTKSWSYPAIADGRLYIRDRESLWCYDVKAGK